MKFSIIIPLYNKAPYVKKALETVCAQTYREYEIIVINDGSTDNSAIIAEDYLNGVEGISYKILSQQNAGVSAARNNGVAQASGDYIAFLDADDWWEPTFLEKMAQHIEDYPEAGLYASNYMYYKPGKTRVAVKNIETGYFNYPKAYYEGDAMPVCTGATMIPRRVMDETGGFPLGIKLGEDFLLWAKIAMQYKVAFLNEPLAWYNNDVPVNLRATRNLHHPKYHMLFNLVLLGEEAKGDDWQMLIDKLRVNSLLEYWISKEYHHQAAEELEKVDWTKQPANVKSLYKTPIWILKAKRLIMRWGSFVKRLLFRGPNKVATV